MLAGAAVPGSGRRAAGGPELGAAGQQLASERKPDALKPAAAASRGFHNDFSVIFFLI